MIIHHPHLIHSLSSEGTILSEVLFLWVCSAHMITKWCMVPYSAAKTLNLRWVVMVDFLLRWVWETLASHENFDELSIEQALVPLRKKHVCFDQLQGKQECFALEYKKFDCIYSYEQASPSKNRWASALKLHVCSRTKSMKILFQVYSRLKQNEEYNSCSCAFGIEAL